MPQSKKTIIPTYKPTGTPSSSGSSFRKPVAAHPSISSLSSRSRPRERPISSISITSPGRGFNSETTYEYREDGAWIAIEEGVERPMRKDEKEFFIGANGSDPSKRPRNSVAAYEYANERGKDIWTAILNDGTRRPMTEAEKKQFIKEKGSDPSKRSRSDVASYSYANEGGKDIWTTILNDGSRRPMTETEKKHFIKETGSDPSKLSRTSVASYEYASEGGKDLWTAILGDGSKRPMTEAEKQQMIKNKGYDPSKRNRSSSSRQAAQASGSGSTSRPKFAYSSDGINEKFTAIENGVSRPMTDEEIKWFKEQPAWNGAKRLGGTGTTSASSNRKQEDAAQANLKRGKK